MLKITKKHVNICVQHSEAKTLTSNCTKKALKNYLT